MVLVCDKGRGEVELEIKNKIKMGFRGEDSR